jgi:hypothetical protein
MIGAMSFTRSSELSKRRRSMECAIALTFRAKYDDDDDVEEF